MPNHPRLFLSPPHMSGRELAYVKAAFESNYIAPLGPMVDDFERAFAEKVGIAHTVALASGTAAMHLAMRILDVGPGDEVFASTLTFMGSVSPVIFQGARPVFIDADPQTWNLDPDLLAEELLRCSRGGRLPKAVVPTDLYGQSVDLDRIMKICEPYGVPVVADSAESLGATCRGRHAGAGARATVFSFNGNKIITTSGGGLLASDDGAFIARARYLSQQARQPFAHYEHTEIGYNYRMSNIVAAIGLGQLTCLDERVRRKREIFDDYRAALERLPGISFMPEASYGTSNRWLTVILIDPLAFGADREAVRLALEAQNIESRPVWKPMHLQPVFRAEAPHAKVKAGREKLKGESSKLGSVSSEQRAVSGSQEYPCRVVGGKVAEGLFEKGLCLPSGTAMTKADVQRIVDVIACIHHQG
ncbi:DegT/DnrJ/EryC1/StrS family aminotransferase [Desulfosarcina sp.]|uniref:DegT/DnrJ/EryC1/StrS family aminotransferase n=1 Tax=Desulfosarcina sp. TaxID=2027861 RepID=UPI003970A8D8